MREPFRYHAAVTNDATLLAVEIETLWVRDDAARLLHTREANPTPAPDLVIARAGDEVVVATGTRIPQPLIRELTTLASAGSPNGIDSLRDRLEPELGRITVAQTISYLVPGDARPTRSPDVVTSSDSHRTVRPPIGAEWHADEWSSLLNGELGPWAAVVVEGETAALCYSARLGDLGAEAGVFTTPGHRGRGFAATVTAAWASEFPPGNRHLFYSTSAENVSSQRVAARLGLREFGRMWQFFGPTTQNVGHG